MFTIKVNWNTLDFPTHSVYTATKYSVNTLKNGDKQIFINNGPSEQNEVVLSGGCSVYVMNDRGATIDYIFLPRNKPQRVGEVKRGYDWHKNHTDDCSVWNNVQQCDTPGPDAVCNCR